MHREVLEQSVPDALPFFGHLFPLLVCPSISETMTLSNLRNILSYLLLCVDSRFLLHLEKTSSNIKETLVVRMPFQRMYASHEIDPWQIILLFSLTLPQLPASLKSKYIVWEKPPPATGQCHLKNVFATTNGDGSLTNLV